MNYLEIKQHLETDGYVIIPNVLNQNEITKFILDFYQWKDKIPQHDKIHKKINPYGIYRFHEIGHQTFIWKNRINPKIQNIFKYLWNTNDLIVSFDGMCYIPPEQYKKDKSWIHVDQAPKDKTLKCYQSFISFTDNSYKTLVVYQGSHLLFNDYFENNQDTEKWQVIKSDFLEKHKDKRRILKINKGDLVIWDSRTFHQCQYGEMENKEERIVQYISYLSTHHIDNTIEHQQLRTQLFLNRRTTTHWACPIEPNTLQPAKYTKIHIDYSNLITPNLDEIQTEINKLL